MTGYDDDNLPPPLAKPCNDCPWRRAATPGWLGNIGPEEWLAIAHSEEAIACHQTISQKHGEWSDPGMRQCTGAAIFRRNVCKSPHNETDATHEVDQDKETVFAWNDEFLDHHSTGPVAEAYANLRASK